MTTAAHPDLAGRVAVVAAASPAFAVAITRVLAAQGMLLAVVCHDRAAVTESVGAADEAGVPVVGACADPSDAPTWERIAPHAEQRLGPIDVVVVEGDRPARDLAVATFLPDMSRRRWGAVIEIGADPAERPAVAGVRLCADAGIAADGDWSRVAPRVADLAGGAATRERTGVPVGQQAASSAASTSARRASSTTDAPDESTT